MAQKFSGCGKPHDDSDYGRSTRYDTRYNRVEQNRHCAAFSLGFPFRFSGISHGLDPEFHPSRKRNGTLNLFIRDTKKR